MSKSIYLSPSTQENNIGAGNYGTEERRMNELANIVESELLRHDVTVYRNTPDMTLYDVVEDSNSKNPDLHFAIHSNAGGGKGTEVYCHRFGGIGHTMAKNVYEELSKLTPVSDRGVHEGANFYGEGKPMYELAYTNAPAALAEIDFHDSLEGANWIIENMDIVGKVIARGLLKTLEIPYIPKVNKLSFNIRVTVNPADSNDITVTVERG